MHDMQAVLLTEPGSADYKTLIQNIKCSKLPALAGKRSKEFFSRKMNRSI